MKLFEHKLHPHTPVNVNEQHARELQGINDRIAVFLTRTVGSMQMAYLFICLALVGLLAILGVLSPIVALLVAWLSQTLIQLVLLPVIMVGQNVLNRKSELQTEEAFNTTKKSYHDIEQIMQHLDAQSDELLKQTSMLSDLLRRTKGVKS